LQPAVATGRLTALAIAVAAVVAKEELAKTLPNGRFNGRLLSATTATQTVDTPFCAIWDCISSSSSSTTHYYLENANLIGRETAAKAPSDKKNAPAVSCFLFAPCKGACFSEL